MRRRDFLKLMSGALASAGGCAAENTAAPVAAPAPVNAAPWAQPTADQQAVLLPASKRPDAMLEVFLWGGLSPWETFYVVPEFGDPDRGGAFAGQQWWAFQNPETANVPDWHAACGPGPGAAMLQPWRTDSAGIQVNLGPFIHPLRDRPDLLARMRVWVVQHDAEPHELAIPQAITGLRLGNPRMAALGTHLQRFFSARAPADRVAPHSYAIYQSAIERARENATGATLVGLHRATDRPTVIQLGAETRLIRQLPRPAVQGYKTELDALVQHYLGRYRSRYQIGGADLRAPALDDFGGARQAMQNHTVLQALLSDALTSAADIELCVADPTGFIPGATASDETTAGLRLGASLLTRKDNAAKYVQLIESGIYSGSAGNGYDTHNGHVEQHGTNVMHMCRALADIINQPGEGDPGKIDLDKHFVLLNTEFGRSPYPEFSVRFDDGSGTNHWPWGYLVIGFGGFVDEDRSGIVGAIGENALAIDGITPAEHRAALLLAMGAWPFTEQSFAVGDVRDATTELEAAKWLRERVLGYSA